MECRSSRALHSGHKRRLSRTGGGDTDEPSLRYRKGYRKAFVGSHLLYFKSNDAGQITVVRILHQRMDVAEHL
nr:type II toxin-antitoxin system RelE/ParE family toxin [Rhizobium sp. CCGE 510]